MQSTRMSPSEAALWRLGLFLSFALLLSSVMPAGLVAATFGALVKIGALVSVAVAMVLREPLWVPFVTRWDEAAILFLVGGLAGLFVDPELVIQALAEHGAAR